MSTRWPRNFQAWTNFSVILFSNIGNGVLSEVVNFYFETVDCYKYSIGGLKMYCLLNDTKMTDVLNKMTNDFLKFKEF